MALAHLMRVYREFGIPNRNNSRFEMMSNFKRNKCRQPKFFDPERLNYLDELKEEFCKTKTRECKHETIANLANFAYNPENHQHLFNLSVHEIFLQNIDSPDDFIAVACIKALGNLAPNPLIAIYLGQSESIEKIINCIACNKKHVMDFIINSLLLLATIKRMNISLDQRLQEKIHHTIMTISKEMNDVRVQNYCKIILLKSD